MCDLRNEPIRDKFPCEAWSRGQSGSVFHDVWMLELQQQHHCWYLSWGMQAGLPQLER